MDEGDGRRRVRECQLPRVVRALRRADSENFAKRRERRDAIGRAGRRGYSPRHFGRDGFCLRVSYAFQSEISPGGTSDPTPAVGRAPFFGFWFFHRIVPMSPPARAAALLPPSTRTRATAVRRTLTSRTMAAFASAATTSLSSAALRRGARANSIRSRPDGSLLVRAQTSYVRIS